MHYRTWVIGLFVVLVMGGVALHVLSDEAPLRYTDTEPGFGEVDEGVEEEVLEVYVCEEPQNEMATSLPPIPEPRVNGRVSWGTYWQPMTPEEERIYPPRERGEGPFRVGLQVGHWQLEDVPEELKGLRASSGAQGGGYAEWEVMLEIARITQALLEAEGVVVDVLSATIPVDYVADAFVSLHADGSSNTSVSGFKISGPRNDFSSRAETLVKALYDSYGTETGMRVDNNITRRMSGYYAFNWRRYDHAVHPRTPAVIVETGFLTSPSDRAIIVSQPEIVGRGIAKGILTFLGIGPPVE